MSGSDGYRLETLLELRRKEEQARAVALGAAVARTAEAVAAAAAAEQALRTAGERRVASVEDLARQAASGAASAGDLAGARRFVERRGLEEREAAARLAQARTVVEEARAAEDEARSRLAEAAAERAALEKHREAWEAEQRRERERRTDAALDDMSSRRKD